MPFVFSKSPAVQQTACAEALSFAAFLGGQIVGGRSRGDQAVNLRVLPGDRSISCPVSGPLLPTL